MTQAFNLSQLANNLNSSGQLDATDGLTGVIPDSNLPTLSASKGGTGQTSLTANNVILGNGTSAVQFVAPSTSGNILTSNGTTWVSSAPPSGGVTSLNGQTGAITNTNFNAIGSYSVTSGYSTYYSNGSISPTPPGASGTWRVMGISSTQSTSYGTYYTYISCRIS